MNCAESLDMLLTADPAELRGGRRFVMTAGLAAAAVVATVSIYMNGGSRPGAIAPPAPRTAQQPPAVATTPPSDSTAAVAPLHRQHGIRAVAIQPAAIVAVPIHTSAPLEPVSAPPVSVRPQNGRRAAVFQLADSKVTVVWLY
jgi:predicted lipid-binding transport protein (Tim44 family)